MAETFNFSQVESDRFGMKVFREVTDKLDVRSLKRNILNNKADLSILRMPSLTKDTHYKLNTLGFPYIHADTLVYYHTPLRQSENIPLRNDKLNYEQVDEENIQELEEIIPIIFKGYKNHYYSNSILDEEKINAGYVEWALSYQKSANNKIAWLVKDEGKTVAFATCSFDEDKKECEGVLYGVMPEYSGRGIYSDLIKFTKSYFASNGFIKMWVSTQVQNYSVQKVWQREGFTIRKSYETFHINSMINYSIAPTLQFEFLISPQVIEKFGDFSGDYNPLHFDDEIAKEIGFSGRIAHGMIFQSYLSKFFGTDYPGEGTIFLNNSNVFIAPNYPNIKYFCKISTTHIDNRRGIIYLLAKVEDEKGRICMLSYNTLMNKNLINDDTIQ